MPPVEDPLKPLIATATDPSAGGAVVRVGRTPGQPDNNEFIVIRLPRRL